MKNLILIVLLSFTSIAFSQEQKGLTSPEFQKLKKDYLEMTKSESYRAMRTQTKLIATKTNRAMPVNVKTEEDFNKWIEESISKTQFSSIDEAKSMFKVAKELIAKNMDEFKNVWAQFRKASQAQIIELIESERLGE
jgi:hypothetical protein